MVSIVWRQTVINIAVATVGGLPMMLYAALKRIDRRLFQRFQEQYAQALEKEIVPGCESLLDVGCGDNSPVRRFSARLRRSVGVDCFQPAIARSQSAGIHHEYRVLDVLEIGDQFAPRSFDCVLASEVIEHLPKSDGLRLITLMETIARKKVIIFTPNGFCPQEAYAGNASQAHLSGWEVEEMRMRGFRAIGIHGWKLLRGEHAAIARRPTALWRRVSWLSQPPIARYPKQAFQVLFVKELVDQAFQALPEAAS